MRAFLDHLAVERGLAAHTLDAYRRDLARYTSLLAGRDVHTIGEVTVADVAAHLAGLREGRAGEAGWPVLAASSAARAHAAVRGLHRFAVREGLVPVDVAADVTPPVPPRRLPRALPLPDVERLLEAAGAGGTPASLRDRALLEVLYGTGARISEAVALAADDLDLTEGASAVRLRGKGGKTRVVPVGSYAREAVQAYLVRGRPALAAAGRGATHLFLSARGGPLSRQSGYAALQRAARHGGVAATVSPHVLRHSFATHLLDGGADVRVVQELLGHASVTTTQVYTLVTVEHLREVHAAAHPRAR